MNKKFFIVGLCLLALALIFWPSWRNVREASEASAMLSLMDEIQQAQETHYFTHKRYVTKLTDLPTQKFLYSDGGSPEMLKRFIYDVSPNGQQFTLYWKGRYAKRLIINQGDVTVERTK